MTAFSANPIAYIIPAVILGAVGLYYLYGTVDHVGLAVQSAEAVVMGKQFTPGNTTYSTTNAGGRAWTQAHQNPDVYALSLTVADEQTVGLVSKEMFEALDADDRVRVKMRRTRISGRLQIVEVSR